MKRRLLLYTLLSIAPLAALRADGPSVDPPLPEIVSVRVAPDWTIDAFLARLTVLVPGATVSDSIASRQTYLLDLPPGTDAGAVELILQGQFVRDPLNPDPNRPLIWGEQCYLGQTAEGRTGSVYVSFQGPNAGGIFPTQYSSGTLGLGQAHSDSTGLGVTVAVIDTGVDEAHPELAGRVLPDGFNFLTQTSDTRDLPDGLDNDGDGEIDEAFGHGTFIAGLVALSAPGVNILPIVALDSDGNTSDFTVAKAMYYAIDHGVEVINLSLGSTYNAEAVGDAIEEAHDLGIIVVSAAGNMNREAFPEFPANFRNAFGVASVDENDVRAPFSNFTSRLFISAPGTSANIAGGDPNQFDTTRAILGPVPGGGYAWWQGTSLSTAFVSGAAALIKAQHPEWWWQRCDACDPNDAACLSRPPSASITRCVERIIRDTAVDIAAQNPGFEGLLGAGRLDVAAAVAVGGPAPMPGDLDHDGSVGLSDLALVLAAFGSVHSPADLDGNGHVELQDLVVLLANFGT